MVRPCCDGLGLLCCFRTRMPSRNWWNHEFCFVLENPEGECPFVTLLHKVQVHLYYVARQWSETHQQVHLWLEWPSQSLSFLNWNWPFMPENPRMWLNQNNFAKNSGTQFLHNDVKDSIPVILVAWLHAVLGANCPNQLFCLGAITFSHRARQVWITYFT